MSEDLSHDNHLRAALRHAPDHALSPPAGLSQSILAAARQTRRATRTPAATPAPAVRITVARPRALQWLQQWFASPRLAGGLATGLVAALGLGLWFDLGREPVVERTAIGSGIESKGSVVAVMPPAAEPARADAERTAAQTPAPGPADSPADSPAAAPATPDVRRSDSDAAPRKSEGSNAARREAAAPAAPARARARAETEVALAKVEAPPVAAPAPAPAPAEPAATGAAAPPTAAPATPAAAPPVASPAAPTAVARDDAPPAPAATVADAAPSGTRPVPPAAATTADMPRLAQRREATASDLRMSLAAGRAASAAAAGAAARTAAAESSQVAVDAAASPALALLRRARSELASGGARWSWLPPGTPTVVPFNDDAQLWLMRVAAARGRWSDTTERSGTGEALEVRWWRDDWPQATLRIEADGLRWIEHSGRIRYAPLEPAALQRLRSP